ncbi:hypothetical protein BV898_19950, partial [Hypsibius exemplaris]
MSRPADDDSDDESPNAQSIPRNKRLKTGHLQMCTDRKLIIVLERCQLETVKVRRTRWGPRRDNRDVLLSVLQMFDSSFLISDFAQ